MRFAGKAALGLQQGVGRAGHQGYDVPGDAISARISSGKQGDVTDGSLARERRNDAFRHGTGSGDLGHVRQATFSKESIDHPIGSAVPTHDDKRWGGQYGSDEGSDHNKILSESATV